MENVVLEKEQYGEQKLKEFNPTVFELQSLADSYRGLEIKGIDDKEGYELVNEAQKVLGKKRRYIKDTLKNFRDDAIKFQRAVLDKEKELIAIIEDVEKDLKAKKLYIDEQVKIEERKKELPFRKGELEQAGITTQGDENLPITDEFILSLDNVQFVNFIQEEKQKKIDIELARIEEEKKKIEEEKKRIEHEKEIERIKKETEEKTKKDMELQQKLQKEREEQLERERQDKLNSDLNYKNRLDENGYNDVDFLVTDNGETKILWKKISIYKI